MNIFAKTSICDNIMLYNIRGIKHGENTILQSRFA